MMEHFCSLTRLGCVFKMQRQEKDERKYNV